MYRTVVHQDLAKIRRFLKYSEKNVLKGIFAVNIRKLLPLLFVLSPL